MHCQSSCECTLFFQNSSNRLDRSQSLIFGWLVNFSNVQNYTKHKTISCYHKINVHSFQCVLCFLTLYTVCRCFACGSQTPIFFWCVLIPIPNPFTLYHILSSETHSNILLIFIAIAHTILFNTM